MKRKHIPSYEMFVESLKTTSNLGKINEGRGNSIVNFNGERIPMYYIDIEEYTGKDTVIGVDFESSEDEEELIESISKLIESKLSIDSTEYNISTSENLTAYGSWDIKVTIFDMIEENALKEIETELKELTNVTKVITDYELQIDSEGHNYNDLKNNICEILSNNNFSLVKKERKGNEHYLYQNGSYDYDVVILGTKDNQQFVLWDNEWSVGIGLCPVDNYEVDTDYVTFEAESQNEYDLKLGLIKDLLKNKNINIIMDELVEWDEDDDRYDVIFEAIDIKVLKELENENDLIVDSGSYGTSIMDGEIDAKLAHKLFQDINTFYKLTPYSGAWTSGTPISVNELK